MNQFLGNFLQFLDRYTLQQKLWITGAVIGLISSLVALMLWANRPEYELLYSNLESGTAGAIIEDLRDNNIQYQLQNGGRSVYVPSEYVTEMRLKYVQSDILKDGITGYELFETNSMGMTTFMQRLNMRRALEGELTRTISAMPEVVTSRVHLVIPEERLFEQDKKGSASVVLHTRPGVSLSQKQISGIVALVSNSVENLGSQDVVVLGSNGEIYSKSNNQGAIGDAGGKWELQTAVESEYQRKITDIVEGVVGHRNSVVNVSVELNFDQLERTLDEVDPDKVAIISEESYNETGNAGANGKTEKITSNYELSRKQEHFVSTAGEVRRVSVAVLVNGKLGTLEEEGGTTTTYEPRSSEELEEIATLVKSSIGFSDSRGDIVEVKNLPFDNSLVQADRLQFTEMLQQERIEKYSVYGITALGLLLAFLLLRTLLRSAANAFDMPGLLQPALAGAAPANAPVLAAGNRPSIGVNAAIQPGSAANIAGATAEIPSALAQEEISDDEFVGKLSAEARAKLRANDYMTQEIYKFIDASPEDASKLLRSWLVAEKHA